MLEIMEHSLVDSVKLIPFLFLTYLAMEWLEHRAGTKTQAFLQKRGRLGSIIGSLLGVVPQCGFGAAASNLYAGRVITMGTLIAIFLSTSDEMLPILISEAVGIAVILKILAVKIVIGMAAGLLIDFVIPRRVDEHDHIHEMCEHENCRCGDGKGIFRSALVHTLKITLFLVLITFVLNLILHNGGEEILAEVILNRPVIGPLIAGVVGLIPNCASSVVITQLYLEGVMSSGAMMAGLLAGSGVGLLVLFKSNTDRKEDLKILGLLYGIGVIAGIAIDFLGISF